MINGPTQIDTRDEVWVLITINNANVNASTIKSNNIITSINHLCINCTISFYFYEMPFELLTLRQ